MKTKIAATQSPRCVANLSAYVNPVFLQATYASQPAGVAIVGNGTIPHPLDVKLSAVYRHAAHLLGHLQAILDASAVVQNGERLLPIEGIQTGRPLMEALYQADVLIRAINKLAAEEARA